MDIFKFRDNIIDDYARYVKSFIKIRNEIIERRVFSDLQEGLLYPDALVQLNPYFESGESIEGLVKRKVLHPECARIFRARKDEIAEGYPITLHKHQSEAIEAYTRSENFILTTGTGSGKSLGYIIPIVDHVIKNGSGKGIKAIIVYPMNALVNSQQKEFEKFIKAGYPVNGSPLSMEIYTGPTDEATRDKIMNNPPDILLTNYVMLDLILTRPRERKIVDSARDLRFLVFDELHTYRGRQGADVAMLIRRVREELDAHDMLCIGTSATIAGKGSIEQQKQEVANVAEKIFGAEFKSKNIIGESLVRSTHTYFESETELNEKIRYFFAQSETKPPEAYSSFIKHPLSIWIENQFGLYKEDDGELKRVQPISISDASKNLSQITSVSIDICRKVIKDFLLKGYKLEPNNPLQNHVFGFRLHQFINGGDTVYGLLKSPLKASDISMSGQYYASKDKNQVYFPMVFCRECGQEFYSVYHRSDDDVFEPRLPYTDENEDGVKAGFLYINNENPWPLDIDADIARVPDDWVEELQKGPTVKRNYRKYLPKSRFVNLAGIAGNHGIKAAFIPKNMRFCPTCQVQYAGRVKEFTKFASLGFKGRATAITILTLSVLHQLGRNEEIPQKLLSFIDNRQDASLQTGHFNDFVNNSILRAAIYSALSKVENNRIRYEELTERIFCSLKLSLEDYSRDLNLKYNRLKTVKQVLKDIIGYRVFNDLKRGWRITMPNLEQCGLLEIEYDCLNELSRNQSDWDNTHTMLAEADWRTREKILKVFLDHVRRSLAISTVYLTHEKFDSIKRQSENLIMEPWSIGDADKFTSEVFMFPRSRYKNDATEHLYISSRSAFGQYLNKSGLTTTTGHIKLAEKEEIILALIKVCVSGGLLVEHETGHGKQKEKIYQIPASAMIWRLGSGKRAYQDELRVSTMREEDSQPNEYFKQFYISVAKSLKGLKAETHTAQVDAKDREMREQGFRDGKINVIFCSPTMELGIDIKQLSLVNMRNVPPTPANYAQRSGRAGRSGQPALVYTFCSKRNPHDQYFFKRPDKMASGFVETPMIELANEDLVRSHIHAIWLSQTRQHLGNSLKDILDLELKDKNYPVKDEILNRFKSQKSLDRSLEKSRNLLKSILIYLDTADWYSDDWLDKIHGNIIDSFNEACDRWRGLYLSALSQLDRQNKIIKDPTRDHYEKKKAKILRSKAESQLEILLAEKDKAQADFYSYRYLASEGFLPGYSFPRLPISAYIQGNRGKNSDNGYIQRPRFLAISEFGPRSIIYHEGSRYVISRILTPIEQNSEAVINTQVIKVCETCGYVQSKDNDICEFCNSSNVLEYGNMTRLKNVDTVRREKINCDEDERQRLGYIIKTAYYFPTFDGRKGYREILVESKTGQLLGKISVAHGAQIMRINKGWKRDKNPNGFMINIDTGEWARNQDDEARDDHKPDKGNFRRVIPYAEDKKNCMIFEPSIKLDKGQMASLQAAFKSAIQVVFRLESSELAAEPLPSHEVRDRILFYESAEGGAGVLRNLLSIENAIQEIAKEALRLCHFDPDNGKDCAKVYVEDEECKAACYDCLMSYYNQRDHKILDRKSIASYLKSLADSKTKAPQDKISSVNDDTQSLKYSMQTSAEREWLEFVSKNNSILPDAGHKYISFLDMDVSFIYQQPNRILIVVSEKDAIISEEKLDEAESKGWKIVQFGKPATWEETFKKYSYLFGNDK